VDNENALAVESVEVHSDLRQRSDS
jgi:hypothetical protein